MIYFKKIEFNEFISNVFINKNHGIQSYLYKHSLTYCHAKQHNQAHITIMCKQKVIRIDILLHIIMQSSIIKLTKAA